ncbi:6,7-dimethyl-8-ribityllumazine synthase [Candidiatus Paracoxiella cheracis]|uniref:6,7-dimethyl-8-ribityllumazine synthase n=1 Tax=Candidiatus Paracoxiella cheracis TaxID=3405120 RepID=UPI003BF4CFA4
MIEKSNAYKLGIIVSRFNHPVTQALLDGAMARADVLKLPKDDIKVIWVPGAVELPLMAQQLAKSLKYDAVICLGAVIKGETNHYDHVCQQVSLGCQQVALQYDIPVIFGVLTTQNKEQAFARAGGERGNKGEYAVDAALQMIDNMRQVHVKS